MIVSASYRTDIPAFYGDWFLHRLRAGYCRVMNPYGGPASRVSLARADVDGFVFWTRNAAPFATAVEEVSGLGFPFFFQFTAIGYPRAIDTSVIAASSAVAQMRSLAERFGPRAVVWRYDPVVFTSVTDAAWHRDNFAALAGSLRGATDEVVVSFVTPYQKSRRNLDAASTDAGFSWYLPCDQEKQALLAELAAIATAAGMRLTLCTQPDLESVEIGGARCIDSDRMSDIAGYPIRSRTKGNRPGCLCTESRDIGAYDTCPHGCAYCYAVRRPAVAKGAYRRHDPASDSLAPVAGRGHTDAAAQAEVSTRRSSGSPLATPTMAARNSRPFST